MRNCLLAYLVSLAAWCTYRRQMLAPFSGLLLLLGGVGTQAQPLQLNSLTPAANSRSAARNTDVVAGFTQPLSQASGQGLVLFSQQAGGKKAATATVSGNTLTVDAALDFKSGETVMATLTTAIGSSSGTPLDKARVMQFTTAVAPSLGIFSGGSEVGIGNISNPNPYSVAVGDVDGDGDLDLLAANGNSNTISVRLNDGSGAYSGSSEVGVGSFPLSVALGDVDGDGDLDLLAANNGGSGSVSVRLNNGSGAFSGVSEVSVGSGAESDPRSVVVGDVDGDGDLDLLAANGFYNNIIVRLNDGSGAFGGGSEVSVGTSPTSVVVGDVDGDGDLDLLTANANSNNVSVRLNDGTGAFSGGSEVGVGSGAEGYPQSVAVGDVDGDGDLDLLTANTGSNTVSVRLNQNPPFISGFSPASGAVGTLVTVTGTNLEPVATNNIVYVGATRATVTAATATSLTLAVPVGATYAPIRVTSLSSGLSTASRQFFIPTFACGGSINPSSLAARQDFSAGTSQRSLTISDLDGDGKADLVVALPNSGQVSVYRNTSQTGTISPASFGTGENFTTGSSPNSVAIGDVDGDGKPDLVVANGSSLSVLRNTSSAGSITAASFAAKVDFDTGIPPSSVIISDVDGDGKVDLVVSTNDLSTHALSVLRNTSSVGSITTASFAAKVDFPFSYPLTGLAAGDLDGDGKPDLVTANGRENTFSVLRNTSSMGSITTASFAAKVDFAMGTALGNVALGDVDGDGKADLVVSNSSSLSVLRNTSSVGSITAASFAAKVDFDTGTAPGRVAMGDMDGDGKPDLVTANGRENTLSVLRNTSSVGSITAASFAAKVDFATGTASSSVAMGDVDGDGKPEVAVSSGNGLSVFRNTVQTSWASLAVSSVLAAGSYCDDGNWKHYYHPSNADQGVLSLQDNGHNLGSVQASVYVDAQPGLADGIPYLGRHYLIQPRVQPQGVVKVRLYFTVGELAALQAVDPLLGQVQDLGITTYQGPTEDGIFDQSDATRLDFIPASQIAFGTQNGYYYAEFSVAHFSEFWFSNTAVPLPIRLLSFSARAREQGVALDWTTTSQVNNDYFTIERSGDARIFESIGRVAGAGTTQERLSYQYTDTQPLPGTSYYRLKQTDHDGRFTYSGIQSVEWEPGERLLIYPNPFQTSATLRAASSGRLLLYNVEGRLVRSLAVEAGRSALPRGNLSSGLYCFRFYGDNGLVQQGKLVLE